MTKLVVIPVEELKGLMHDVVVETMVEAPRASAEPAKAVLDRKGLATALDVSLAAVDRLRSEPGFPEIRIGDAPRFELDRVLVWLRDRGTGPALRVVSG